MSQIENMRKIKYAIIHNYKKALKKDGTAAVYVRAYLNKKCHYINTDVYVMPKQWDNRNCRIINHPRQYQLNREVREILDKIEAYEQQFRDKKQQITLKQLGDYKNTNRIESFTDFYREQLEQSPLSTDSYTDQRQTLHKLEAYKAVVYFHELNYRLIDGFNKFLHQKGLSVNTIAKHHKNLKKYINQAIKYDLLDINLNPYKRFKVKKQPTQRVFLTAAELKKVEGISIPKDKLHLARIKDFFLFCCYTGLRFSDANRVSKSHLTVDDSGVVLAITAQKTKKPWQHNLRRFFPTPETRESRPETIVNKYLKKHLDFYGRDDFYASEPLFQGVTNQYINRELKVLVEDLDIRQAVKEKISMHTARHTFGTIMAGKVPIHVLQQLLQHSKIKETMIYVHLSQQIVSDALDEVNW